MSYAIKNERTGRFVYATDYGYHPPHQKTSRYRALLFEDYETADRVRKSRQCTSYYEVVPVIIMEDQEHDV